MADFSEWMRGMHTEQGNDSKTLQHKYTQPSLSSSDNGWSSENDTDSESEQSNSSFECNLRRKNIKTKTPKFFMDSPSRASPVTIPARTHDFGWCDQDRESFSACPCGNDCNEFFGGDIHQATRSNQCEDADSGDDFIFDMEM